MSKQNKKPDFTKINTVAGKPAPAPAKPVETLDADSGGAGRKTASKAPQAKKSLVGGHFMPEVGKQLKLVALEQDKTIQQCLGEALNDYFAKHGKAEIAHTDRG